MTNVIKYSNIINMTIDKEFEPQKTLVIRSEEQVKEYIHLSRMRILSLLAKEKRTITGVAKEFNVHPANITHHFKRLEKAGLIKIVERRDIGKTVEKYYRAIALHFDILPPKNSVKNKKALVLRFLRDDLTSAINQINEQDASKATALLENIKLEAKDFDRFSRKLKNLVGDFKKYERKDGVPYSLNLSLYRHNADYGPTGTILL